MVVVSITWFMDLYNNPCKIDEYLLDIKKLDDASIVKRIGECLFRDLNNQDKKEIKLSDEYRYKFCCAYLVGIIQLYYYRTDLYKKTCCVNSVQDLFESARFGGIEKAINELARISEHIDQDLAKNGLRKFQYKNICKEQKVNYWIFVEVDKIPESLIRIAIIVLFNLNITSKEIKKASELIRKNYHIFPLIKEREDIRLSKDLRFIDGKKMFFYNLIADYNLKKKDIDSFINKEFLFEELKKDDHCKAVYLMPGVEFYINYYYLLKNDCEEEARKMFDCLTIFENGFGLDDFFTLEKMQLEIRDIKNKEIDIDKKIDEISEAAIKRFNLSNYNTDNLNTIYENIDFSNISDQTKKYILTCDIILNLPKQISIFDYSSAIIELSKAVEYEINCKIINILFKHKKEIEKYGNVNALKKQCPFKLTKYGGVFKAFEEYGLENKVFEYVSQVYTIDKDQFLYLCKCIKDIWGIRNDSAHKDITQTYEKAIYFKEYVLSINKILEILSKLKKKTKNINTHI